MTVHTACLPNGRHAVWYEFQQMFYFNILQLQLGFAHYISRRYWKVLVLCIIVSIRFYPQCFKQVLEMASLSLHTSITPKKKFSSLHIEVLWWNWRQCILYAFSWFFSDHLQYKDYYCTLYSLPCSTSKKSITWVHIWQTAMPHSAAYYYVTKRHLLHWHRINCSVICSTVWLKKRDRVLS